jgi:hypothetical protein
MPADKTREIRIAIPEELFSLLIPRQTQEHLWKAKKEFLLALRSLIDARIEMTEKQAGPKPEPKRKIRVD